MTQAQDKMIMGKLLLSVSIIALMGTSTPGHTQGSGATPYEQYNSGPSAAQPPEAKRELRSYRDIKRFKRPLESQERFQSVPGSLKPKRNELTPGEATDPRFNYGPQSSITPSPDRQQAIARNGVYTTYQPLAAVTRQPVAQQSPRQRPVTQRQIIQQRPAAQPQPAASSPSSQDYEYVSPNEPFIPEGSQRSRQRPAFRTSLFAGYRMDEIDWNIAGTITGSAPEILSEQKWSDIGVAEVRADVEYTHQGNDALHNVYLAGSAAYGEIIEGEQEVTDLRDDATQEQGQSIASRTNSSADNGDTLNFKAAVGYTFDYGAANRRSDHSWITPMIGYAHSELNLEMSDGVQIVPDSGAFSGLNDTYETEWSGPFIGIKAGTAHGMHRFELLGEYHYADYEASGRLNLRTDLAQPVSYTQDGDATGLVFGGEYNYSFTNALALSAQARYSIWNVEDGINSFLVADAQNPGAIIAQSQKLNEVDWTSQAYRVGLAYSF